ncbi:uncharacterized protein PFL1_03207 [Pseudozyma flocculosa PF-1]|uniref:Uncharacterized protein n=1 Tax=Pseudozyma flocculosa PF-1 TaxID=1277687 RepID=A0A061H973_9BASI|nr:uncharacterized protein PFL1_03207 [Pseudozyma flocculosa PF-1]EPQ29452.1 hypothetical protein PFL1_03207 [Pseudozyma flocculosa PF-1]
MTTEELRPVIPRTESHQSLANNPATSRPPPPRNRNRASQLRNASNGPRSGSSSNLSGPASPAATSPDKDVYQDDPDQAAHAHDGDDRDDDGNGVKGGRYGALGLAHDHAAVPSAIRTSSSGSARSYNSRLDAGYDADEIPRDEIEHALRGLSRDDLVVALGRAKVQMDEIDAKLDAQILASEELQASSNSLLSQLNLAEAENDSLNAVIRQREERIDDLMADQDRMESELYSRLQVIESLRKQLNESEKRRNDAERRYGDQTSTMDKERQYYADTEQLLKSQKATQAASYEKLLSQNHELHKEHERLSAKLAQLRAQGAFGGQGDESDGDGAEDGDGDGKGGGDDGQADDVDGSEDGADGAQPRRPRVAGRSVSGSKRHAARTLAEEKEYATLKEELATIQRSHTSLTEAIATLQTELRDVKGENATLRDQNETFIDILQEKTFSGALLSESAMISAGLGRQRLRGASGLMGPYESDEDEDDEDDEDADGGGADTTGDTSVDDEVDEQQDDYDDVDDVPDTPRAPTRKAAAASAQDSAGKTAGRKVPRRRKQSTSLLAPHPTDLASELGQSGSPQASGAAGAVQAPMSPEEKKKRQERRNERHGAVSDNVEELQKEVRELREANQALTLYIAKIIDRIIAREGYENILAVDGKGTVRGGGARRKQSRTNLRSSPYDTFDNPNQTKRSVSNASAASAASAATTSSSGSGVGGGLFRFGGGGGGGGDAAAAKSGKPVPPKPKRGSSIDWRSLPFLGGGSSNAAPEPNPNLRPLTLASTSPLIGGPSNSGGGTASTPTSAARKLRTSEEVEDEADVAERERIRSELLKRGIQPPSNQLVQSPNSPSTATMGGGGGGSSGGGFAAFFSRVVTGGSGGGTVGATNGGGEVFPRTSTPILSDPSKRREERSRAIQLSGNGLTEFGGGEGEGIGAAARARARARRDRTAHALARGGGAGGLGLADDEEWADGADTGTPDSRRGETSLSSESSSVSAAEGGAGGTGTETSGYLETSIAGDESYSLPPPPSSSSSQRMAGAGAGVSPLMGYGHPLPPLPSMTTGEEGEAAAAAGTSLSPVEAGLTSSPVATTSSSSSAVEAEK